MGALLTSEFHRAALDQFQNSLFEIAEGLWAGTAIENGAVSPPDQTDARATRVFSGRYWEIAAPRPGGITAIVRSRSLWDQQLPPPPGGVEALSAKLGDPVYYDVIGPEHTRLRAVALMGMVPKRSEPLIFMAAQDRKPIEKSAAQFGELTIFALILLCGGVIVAVILQVRFGLKPLFALGSEIADVRKGKAPRLSGRYPREIAPLAQEMNALLDHNQEVLERQRTHVGNLAHALKTPLAVIASEAETSPGPLAEVAARQASLMREQIDHHLRRARAAARSQSLGERTLVEPALDELARMLERVHLEKGVTIDWGAPSDLAFRGERQDLLEVIGNLLENACKWCKRRVDVSAEPEAGGLLRLVVEDDGPGLPQERRAEVLKRGARLDESAPGSGLGLSIVDELARAYGGKVELDRSKLGGLKVSVVLPAAES